MARKKIVLVIVEGPSDNAALGVMLNQVYDKDSVYVYTCTVILLPEQE